MSRERTKRRSQVTALFNQYKKSPRVFETERALPYEHECNEESINDLLEQYSPPEYYLMTGFLPKWMLSNQTSNEGLDTEAACPKQLSGIPSSSSKNRL